MIENCPFIHLHVHSEYSLSDGLLRISDLIKTVKAMGMHSVAITDQSNLFAMIKFYRAAEAAGIKPILGADVWIRSEDPLPHRIILLCENNEGFQGLMSLLSRAYTEGMNPERVPEIHLDWLLGQKEGLIVLAKDQDSNIARHLQKGQFEAAVTKTKAWLQWFPDSFFLEITRVGRLEEAQYSDHLLRLAQITDCPLVASNAVRFLNTEDFEAHETRVCIHQGVTLMDEHRPRIYTDQQYLRSPEAMQALFSDLPEVLQNSVEIALRCNVTLTLGQAVLPNYPIPEQETIESYLSAMANQGLEKRGRQYEWLSIPKPYQDRLNTELKVINDMGFAGYFLIVADFIRWAKTNGVPVGPGRGSGVGSLVAYALTITDLDPLPYDLLFERFLNPERVSMPDFDIDFCMDGRDRVIDYVAQKYGRQAVSQIITYGTMAAKAVIRDVGRAMGVPYGVADKIAKLVPMELGITLEKALTDEPLLKERYDQDDDVRALMDMAKKLEGITRNAGKHAGGVVIAPNRLTDFTPLYCDADGSLLTQLDKNDVELAGLVKFDFLGLRTLTIIDWALQSLNLQIETIPLTDPKTFQLLQSGQTTAVFQLESRGLKDLIRRLQPDTFEDIIALVALYRPGPLQSGMVDDFVDRKRGRAPIEYPHPDLEPVLKSTYGIILYQEQVMQIAQILAGYTLGGADLLRRAMGKKKPEEMAKQRVIFLAGALEKGIDQDKASHIFDLMEKFAGYGFNKSHAAGYALITYQTAWLKTHFPAHFMAAVLSSDMNHIDKVTLSLEETQRMGLTVLPPDIQVSEARFVPQNEKSIRYGLGAIKGLGGAAIAQILEARACEPFKDLWDFCRRVDGQKVTKRALEALIKCGALDSFDNNRANLMGNIEIAVQAAEQIKASQQQGQTDLFMEDFSASVPQYTDGKSNLPSWSEEQRLFAEKETLGHYLSGHPITVHRATLASLGVTPLKALKPDRQHRYRLAGFLMNFRTMQTRRGSRIGIATLDDQSARQDIILFNELFQAHRQELEVDKMLLFEAQVSEDAFSGGLKVTAQRIFRLPQAQAIWLKSITLQIPMNKASIVTELLRPYVNTTVGQTDLWIDYEHPQATVRLKISRQIHFTDTQIFRQLRLLCGEDALQLSY